MKTSYPAAIAAILLILAGPCLAQKGSPTARLLSNDGQTNSLDTLVQYLFNIPAFRKAVYASQTDMEFVTELQRVFYQMQYNGCSDTSTLAGFEEWSFVEDPGTADVSELRLLLLGTILEGTDMDESISALFAGSVENTLEAPTVNYRSAKENRFLSVFLGIDEAGDLPTSLQEFTSDEFLEGENQLFVKEEGLVDGVRSSKFASLPPVLQLNLKRYFFNGAQVEKLNTRFEYPTSLDFEEASRKLLADKADENIVNEYRLHSVIAHEGNAQEGHYSIFAQVPDPESGEDKWYKFDGDEVEEVEESDAVENLFGDGSESENAYSLTYVRMSDWDKVIGTPAGKKDLSKKQKLFKGETAECSS